MSKFNQGEGENGDEKAAAPGVGGVVATETAVNKLIVTSTLQMDGGN